MKLKLSFFLLLLLGTYFTSIHAQEKMTCGEDYIYLPVEGDEEVKGIVVELEESAENVIAYAPGAKDFPDEINSSIANCVAENHKGAKILIIVDLDDNSNVVFQLPSDDPPGDEKIAGRKGSVQKMAVKIEEPTEESIPMIAYFKESPAHDTCPLGCGCEEGHGMKVDAQPPAEIADEDGGDDERISVSLCQEENCNAANPWTVEKAGDDHPNGYFIRYSQDPRYVLTWEPRYENTLAVRPINRMTDEYKEWAIWRVSFKKVDPRTGHQLYRIGPMKDISHLLLVDENTGEIKVTHPYDGSLDEAVDDSRNAESAETMEEATLTTSWSLGCGGKDTSGEDKD